MDIMVSKSMKRTHWHIPEDLKAVLVNWLSSSEVVRVCICWQYTYSHVWFYVVRSGLPYTERDKNERVMAILRMTDFFVYSFLLQTYGVTILVAWQQSLLWLWLCRTAVGQYKLGHHTLYRVFRFSQVSVNFGITLSLLCLEFLTFHRLALIPGYDTV